MATQLAPATPQQQAVQLLQQLNALLPSLTEPYKGAISFAQMIVNNPALDEKFCDQAGKVVHVTATLTNECQVPVTLRGENGPLLWTTDLAADADTDFFSRSFTFAVPPAQMNDTISFKLTTEGRTPGTLLWQSGRNCTIDLSQYGHIVDVKVSNVKFA